MKETRCHYQKIQFYINKQMNCIVFPLDFAICVSNHCVNAYRKGYVRQNFQGLHLKQQHQQQHQLKNPHIISLAVRAKERKNDTRQKIDRDGKI